MVSTKAQEINNILFRLCLFITIVAMAMMLVGFFTKGTFPPAKIGTFYLVVLLLYSAHKEAFRWIEEKGSQQQQRNGEYFVYAWIVITVVLYLVNFLTRGYFNYPLGIDSPALSEITFTTIEVCGVFILTQLSKMGMVHFFKNKQKGRK